MVVWCLHWLRTDFGNCMAGAGINTAHPVHASYLRRMHSQGTYVVRFMRYRQGEALVCDDDRFA